LLAALRWYAGEITARYGLPVEVIGNKKNKKTLPMEIRLVLYRIAQEAITNVVRHSGASEAKIRISRTEGEVILQIEDNGSGFDVQTTLHGSTGRQCWGLIGMIERVNLVGGACTLSSEPGKGTTVKVSVPCCQADEE
jgi:signal transduction histidine kinase